MEDNRFLRAYQEHKIEKEQLQNYSRETNTRFDCLIENRSPPIRQDGGRFDCLRENRNQYIREDSGRFDCLRGDLTYSNQDIRVTRESNRFSCLTDNDYRSTPRQQERITYLPKPEPKESVNAQMRRYVEEKRAKEATRPPPPPVFSVESNYHFPELGKTPELSNQSKMPKPKPEVKLPEPKAQKEMIVNTIIIPDKRKTMTLMCFKDGKLESKEVYEDGSEVPETGTVVLKKPIYNSWASVIKSDTILSHTN
jgi:hypothetical protein